MKFGISPSHNSVPTEPPFNEESTSIKLTDISYQNNHFWDSAPFYSKWTYICVNPFLRLGESKTLQEEDMLPLSPHDDVCNLLPQLTREYAKAKKFCFVPRLMVALLRSHVNVLVIMSVLTAIESACVVLLPVILFELLKSLSNSQSTDADNYKWAAILGGIGLCQTITHHILFFFSMRLGWNWRASVTGLIYDRVFKLNSNSKTSHTTGKLVNLISNDVARFEEFSIFGSFGWAGLLILLAILIILIVELNVAAGFAGVGATLILIPVQIKLAELFAKVRGQTAGATDQRVRYISEVIDGIASVKSYGWEKPFYSLIETFRDQESKCIAKSQRIRAINQGVYYSASTVASFATFLVFWGTGNKLTLPIVFSTLALLQTLRTVIGKLWTRGIETGSEALASCYRIEAFLNLVDESSSGEFKATSETELKEDGNGYMDEPRTGVAIADDSLLVSFHKTNFYYGDDINKPTIKNLEFNVHKGELVMIVGAVGAGKSSILAAVLDEIKEALPTPISESRRYMNPKVRIAYCSQRAWILAASVRANITLAGANRDPNDNFKKPKKIDEELYARSLECCRIVDDLNQWPAYDETEVGERGISISGGQKARISLARAVYSDCELQLLDDPLSAVDAHVGHDLFHDCILNELRGKGKGIILATHQLQYLKFADKIVVLNDNGEQVFYGKYSELSSRANEFPFLDIQVSSEEVISTKNISESNSFPSVNALSRQKSLYNSSKRFVQKTSNMSPEALEEMEKNEAKRKIIQVEDRVEGAMSFDLFNRYLQSGGVFRGLFAISLAIFSQGFLMITEYWLRWWASNRFGDQSENKYVYIYAILTFSCMIIGMYRATSWFEFTLGASNGLHAKCLWALMHSPLQFFIANPTGRILNRFSRDTNQADELLPFTLFDFMQSSLQCLGAVALICVSLPWLVLMVPLLFYGFLAARRKYLISAREIKRIDATTRSPIYADFSATLEGLVTLRAYSLRESFTKVFQQEINVNGQAFLSFMMVSRWLGFRLDLMCSSVLIAVAFLAVGIRSQIDIGLIGFALVYTMALSGQFQWTVRQSAEVEAQMTAVERIASYCNLPPEPGYETTLDSYNASDKNTKSQYQEMFAVSQQYKGKVELKDLTVTYREDLDPVLSNLEVTISSGEKVGICGRTGSGKSSTLLALLRLNLITGGDILIDGESLLKMSLEKARSIISVIPQDPHLFSGTVRFNLDPFNIYTDQEVWDSLRDAHIFEYISRDAKGLLASVDEGGKNFSVGQRQLLSLARAILRRSKVLLCDEVTASIDFQTDRLIQATIRTSPALKNATIITVAHRLRTIADSDKIVVIQKGKLVEYGKPVELLEIQNGLFQSLAVESNEFNEIYDIAKRSNSDISESV